MFHEAILPLGARESAGEVARCQHPRLVLPPHLRVMGHQTGARGLLPFHPTWCHFCPRSSLLLSRLLRLLLTTSRRLSACSLRRGRDLRMRSLVPDDHRRLRLWVASRLLYPTSSRAIWVDWPSQGRAVRAKCANPTPAFLRRRVINDRIVLRQLDPRSLPRLRSTFSSAH